MGNLVFWRLAFCAFIIGGLIAVISIYERKDINKKPPSQTPPADTKTESKKESIKNNTTLEGIIFPENFFFGTASSDFQTTGGTGHTDWNNYINFNQGKRDSDDNVFVGPENGTDFLNRYKEDFFLAGQIGIQVHRISLEWARLEPEEGKWNMEAVQKYKEIFKNMKAYGIEPMICLNHFALPIWFSEKGGWENPQAAYHYSRYAEFIAKNIGAPLKIKWWLTFNEPQLVASIPYAKGSWPPFKGIKSLTDSEGTKRFLLVVSHVFDSHRLAYRSIHKVMDPKIKVMVSFASAPGSFSPNDPNSKLDQMAYNIFNTLYTLSGDYLIGTVDKDFIGLNYYGHTPLKLGVSIKNMIPGLSEDKPFYVDWIKPDPGSRPKYFKPRALYDLIMEFKDLGLPIIITENGLSDPDDKFREEFIVIHLKAIHDAMRGGANVIGYQYWALTDTWEWDGNFSQMGLIKINRDNKSLDRSPRSSAYIYAEIIKTKKITKELQEKHKELLPN